MSLTTRIANFLNSTTALRTTTMSASHPSVTREHEIPSIVDTSSSVTATNCYSNFSFCLATSLSVAKCLTWEQTPWAHPKLPAPECQQIAEMVSLHTKLDVSFEAVRNAIIIGSTYRPGTNADDGINQAAPQLFVVFPHLQRDVSQDSKFLKLWHDEIAKPAFDTAWEESGMVNAWRKDQGGFHGQRINIPHTGPRSGHERTARTSSGIIELLQNKKLRRVYEPFPAWVDRNDARGGEGSLSDTRAKVFDEAWKSMTGMLKDHADLKEFQNPVLVAVYRGHGEMSTEAENDELYRAVGAAWDKTVDSRYVVPGTFRMELRTVIGDNGLMEKALAEDEEEKEARAMQEYQGNVVDFKRMAADMEEPEQGTPQRKRARR